VAITFYLVPTAQPNNALNDATTMSSLNLCRQQLAKRTAVHSYYSTNYKYPLSLSHLDTLPLRSNRPVNDGEPPDSEEISDQEWEIRTGILHFGLRYRRSPDTMRRLKGALSTFCDKHSPCSSPPALLEQAMDLRLMH
jgi:hypothetical protein